MHTLSGVAMVAAAAAVIREAGLPAAPAGLEGFHRVAAAGVAVEPREEPEELAV